MSNPRNNPPQSKELPPHLIEQFIENQKQQLLVQQQEMRLREKELDSNAKLAEKQLTIQGDLLKNKPAEQRKTFKLFGVVICSILLIFLGFFAVCLYMNHEGFALRFFQYMMYAVTSIVGYYVGKKSSTKNQDKKTEEDATYAEILNK